MRYFYFLSIFFGLTKAVVAQPKITSFSPTSGPIGTTVTITGTGFNDTASKSIVYFGAVKAVVDTINSSSTSVRVNVPYGASYKPITVTSKNTTGYSEKPFSVLVHSRDTILTSSFDIPKSFTSSGIVTDVVSGDIDGDGKADVAITNPNQNTISIFRNTSTKGNISFAARIDLATGLSPNGLTIGDLDGDGKLDLVASNHAGGASSISVLRNLSTPGNILFGAQQQYNTGNSTYSNPENIAIGDLNGDGKPEIVVVNSGSSSISVYPNQSTSLGISLAPKIEYTTAYGCVGVSIGDLNNDKKPDIVVTNQNAVSNSISVYTNTGVGVSISFSAKDDYPAYNAPYDVSITDLNNDGKPDLAFGNSGSAYISIYQNISNTGGVITLSPRTDIKSTTSGDFQSIDVADMDGDGKPDIVVADNNSFRATVRVFKNNGTNNAFSFAPEVIVSTSGGSRNLTVSDYDNDGTQDIAACIGSTSTFLVYRNKVASPQLLSLSPSFGGIGTEITIKGYNFVNVSNVKIGGVSSSSFNVLSDTIITAVVGAGASGNVVVNSVDSGSLGSFSFYNKPVITSCAPTAAPIGATVTIKGANFSAVAAQDIVYFGSVKAIALTATSNTITIKVPPGANYSPISVTTNKQTAYSTIPFNVTFTGSPAAFLPKSFDTRQDFSTATFTQDFCTADLDGDGKSDIIVTGNSNTISVFRNTSILGAVRFDNKKDFITAATPVSIKPCDVDGDGMLDLVVLNTSAGTISILKNTSSVGNINFAAKIDVNVSQPGSIQIGDIDADGMPDIIFARTTYSGAFSILRNTSTASAISFALQQFSASGHSLQNLSVNDLNGDGKPEVIISNSGDDVITIYKNTSSPGSISFVTGTDIISGDGPTVSLSIADVDLDGKPDITLTNYNGASVSIFKNISTSEIVFKPVSQFATLTNPVNLSYGDIDGDGKADLGVVNNYLFSSNGTFSLLRNNSSNATLAFNPKVDLIAQYSPNAITISDLDLDGKPEVVILNSVSNSFSVFRNKINEPSVSPSGANPISGDVVSSLHIDSSIVVYNGVPYVQRHYDVEPALNPSTSTATVTIYFSQQEFDNYNAYPGHGLDLPKVLNDTTGKANLRVHQYHGFSATSQPGSYSGSMVEINPDDSLIVWNALAQWWEVTFKVTGFSGFFVTSNGNITLPLQLLSFSGKVDDKSTLLTWKTSKEIQNQYFEVHGSSNGRDFNKIGEVKASGGSNKDETYTYMDLHPNDIINYYRLKIFDRDGAFTYSAIIAIKMVEQVPVSIYPNPAKDYVIVKHPVTATLSTLKVIDNNGRVVKNLTVAKGAVQTMVNIKGLASGNYMLLFSTTNGDYTMQMFVD